MIWNLIKKKIQDENKSHVESIEDPDTASNYSYKRIKLPLQFLKRLIPISNLPDHDIQQLEITMSRHKPGDVIFNRGDIASQFSYIIKGQCFIEASNGHGYEVDPSILKALYPLSNDTHHQCAAIAKSNVSLIHFSHDILHHCYINPHNALLNVEDIPESLQGCLFFDKFCDYYKQGKLIIPTLPDVALKLREAVHKEIGINKAVKIVNLDSVISSKLIQVVNSPLYRTVNTINTCHGAITRLGLTTTRNLVTSISMKNLFKSNDRDLNLRIQNIWKKSIQVSSISSILATQSNSINPDEALLAGLVHNIGALPIIIFAESLNREEYLEEDLDDTITALQGILGNIILKKWGFPEALVQIPRQSENWYHNDGEKINLTDIVILAKFHSYIGSKEIHNLPPIHTLPAFKKLSDNTLTPSMSLQVLKDATKQIADTMGLFVT